MLIKNKLIKKNYACKVLLIFSVRLLVMNTKEPQQTSEEELPATASDPYRFKYHYIQLSFT